MGFDNECIPNIQWLPGEYFCQVCRLLVYPDEAFQSMCTHLFCNPCLTYVATTTNACPYDGYLVTATNAKPLMESNKVLADTIGSIVVQCLYQKSGCTWLGSLSESPSHCSGCAFGGILIVCNFCGSQIAQGQMREHGQVCPGMQQVHVQQSQGFQPVAASNQVQINAAQGQGVASATPTQQQYQQYYQNYYGYYNNQQQAPMSNPQQQLYLPGPALQTASQQGLYVQPAIQYVAQTLSQILQPQLQSQHQPYGLFPSAPHQASPSVPPHPQDPSPTLLASQGPQDMQAQTHSKTTPLSQPHHLQNPQVSQDQQFNEQIRSQLHIQNPSRSQANTAQNSQLPNATGQGQSHQLHANWNGQGNYPKPNQVGVPSNNMNVYHHQFVTQSPQVQNHFPQHVLPGHPPTMQGQQPSVPSQLTSTQSGKQLLRQYGGLSVSESSVVHPAQQPSNPSFPQQSMSGNVGNEMKNRGKCGSDRAGMNDTDHEGTYRYGFLEYLSKKDFERHGNLQMGEKVGVSAGTIGPSTHVPNHLRGGESLPGDEGTFPNYRDREWCSICRLESESHEMHSQTKEHQQKLMDHMVSMIKPNADTLKTAPAECSSSSNPSITHPEDRGPIT